MSKEGERQYFKDRDEGSLAWELNKPFSADYCADYFVEIGAVFALLPPRPARLLDLGCGVGWTSCFYARRGYSVTGVDISPEAIDCANERKRREGIDDRLQFVVGDYEDVILDGEYDCAIFFDSLHHAVDVERAMRAAYDALKTGGTCITSEPGRWHSRSRVSVEVMRKYDVTERDMEPPRIIRVGKTVGFTGFRVYPHASHVNAALYGDPGERFAKGRINSALVTRWLKSDILRSLALFLIMHTHRIYSGIVVMTK